MDQYDTLNMNDNDLKKIENFPYFQRLKILYFANNRIRRIAPDFVQNVPNLEVRNCETHQILQILIIIIYNNRKIARKTPPKIPHQVLFVTFLKELVLSNNELKELPDIDVLKSLEKLEYLSLMGCPMTALNNYRLYVIFRVRGIQHL